MRRILVVDDEEKIRRVYLSLLKQEGFEAIEASSAAQAHGILERKTVDLVLLDIKMPAGDGDRLYEFVQSFYKEAKIIVASVYPVDEQRRMIKDAVDYYDKSQGTEVLLSKVRMALQDEP